MSLIVELGRLPPYIELVRRSSPLFSRTRLPGNEQVFDFDQDDWVSGQTPRFQKPVPPETILRLNNCYVNSHGVVLSPRGERLVGRELGFAGTKVPVDWRFTGSRLGGEFVFGLNQEPHFGHWLLQRLPRIHSVLRRFPGTRVLTSDAIWDPRGMLEAVGAKAAGITLLPHGEPSTFYQVDSLLMANHAAPHGDSRCLDGRRLRRMASEARKWAAKNSAVALVPKIYLSRGSESGFREGCQNRSIVEAAMIEKGFTLLLPERLSFADQVRLVSHAEQICSETGSASILTLFAQNLVEFTEFSTGENYSLTEGPRRNGWTRTIVLSQGAGYRFATLSSSPIRRSWVAEPERLEKVLEKF